MSNILNSTRAWDFRIYYRLYQFGLNSPFIDYFYYFMARYGIVFFFLSFIYLIWRRKISAFFCTLVAMAVAASIDFLVFIFWQRPRPFLSHPQIILPNLHGLNIDPTSFPSSHTYIAFAIATSVFLYGHRRLGSFLFILAIFIAVGRIGTGLHYPTDVIGGALLGILSGLIVFLLVKNAEYYKEVRS